jgi:uncharacterized damage-inducible protein DinB
MSSNFVMLAAYNAWANTRLYDAASSLSKKDFSRDTGAFFRSMKGTLNHILVADRIWMKRFTGGGTAPDALDTILFAEFEPLRQARASEDRRIVEWVSGLDAHALSGRFSYFRASDLRTYSQRLAPALTHFFNHQTHHRGQAHMILTVLGKPGPELDLIYFLRSEEGREFA